MGLGSPASNTTPVVVLRFEPRRGGLDRIKSEFRRVLLSAKPDAKLPFRRRRLAREYR